MITADLFMLIIALGRHPLCRPQDGYRSIRIPGHIDPRGQGEGRGQISGTDFIINLGDPVTKGKGD
jgi:hypothetical protein